MNITLLSTDAAVSPALIPTATAETARGAVYRAAAPVHAPRHGSSVPNAAGVAGLGLLGAGTGAWDVAPQVTVTTDNAIRVRMQFAKVQGVPPRGRPV